MNPNPTPLSRVCSSLLVCAGILLASGGVGAQSLTVIPVNLDMAPRQLATTLTVINQGPSESSVQLRAFDWKQVNGVEELTPSKDIQISPPLASIAPGATQVVRVVLRRSPRASEATYRILVDQIPPPAESGTVRIALRLSIPVFAAPSARSAPMVKYRVESKDGLATLIAVNEGTSHETLRDVTLSAASGGDFKPAANASPYILSGATRTWPVAPGNTGALPAPGTTVRLKGTGISGELSQPVNVVGGP